MSILTLVDRKTRKFRTEWKHFMNLACSFDLLAKVFGFRYIFRGFGFDKTVSGQQQVNQTFKDSFCPRQQGADYGLKIGRPRNPI
jgi:hypothetical protein